MEEIRNLIDNVTGNDERSLMPRESLARRLRSEYSYKPNPSMLSAFVKAYENIRKTKDSTELKVLQKSYQPIFEIAGRQYQAKMFASFLSEIKQPTSDIKSQYDVVLNDMTLAYENSQLERKYPDFGNLMREYHDGLLLFEISSKEVWEKAVSDTAGLETYFNTHRSDYSWKEPHFKGLVIRCASKKVASRAKKIISKTPSEGVVAVLKKTFNTDTTTLVKVEKGLFVKGDNAVADFQVFGQNNNKQDTEFPISFVKGYVLKDGPESLTDVKGLVISDYQNLLEKNWMSELRKKYVVRINEDVVNTVNKD